MKKNYPVALFNGVVITTDGEYLVSTISNEKAKALVDSYGFESAIGHEATANIFSEILNKKVIKNRIQYCQKVNQYAIALKLDERPVEGSILSKEQMLKTGYTLRLIERRK